MPALRELLDKLLERRDLAEAEARELLGHLMNTETAPAMSGAVLAALRGKGVVADELRGFALAMRALARRPDIPADARVIDIVGTGGDASGSVNISTGTSILVAACGLPVVKHGNRSVSSRAGAADVLEVLGLGIPLDEQAAGACYRATQFTFLFAPYFHPAMKAVAPVRAALGVRTVFNILGPLANPQQPPFHVIGAYSREVAELMAQTLAGLNIERTFVIHGANGWDEPTPIGPFLLYDVRPGRVDVQTRDPAAEGFKTCTARDLAGGDAQHNARALRDVLTGEDRGAHRECLLLGAALALECAGLARNLREGAERAAHAIDSGAAARLLDSLAAFGRGGTQPVSGASA
ncbi:MAG TPA: anthranilate phosphoribosyltransferase [Steroidobacteraceae bacterium]|jgi:anthranilate phosphoribosyltransferase|nr:anthranilate phosphoribosyltransferase [Steroidobacteraceae bacterium]